MAGIPKIWPLPPDAELQRQLRAQERNAQGLQFIRDDLRGERDKRQNGLFSGGGEKSTSGASSSGHYLTTQDDTAALPNSTDLGALTTGLLFGTVSGGVSTISRKVIGTDVQAVLLTRTGTILKPATANDTIEYSASAAGQGALIVENPNTADSSIGVVGNASGASGAVVGVKGICASSDNDAYGGYFTRGGSNNATAYAEGPQDFAEVSTPATPPSGIVRAWFDTNGHLNYKDDAGAIHGPIVDVGRSVVMMPIAVAKLDNTTEAENADDRATHVYVGRAWKSVASGSTIKIICRLTRVYQSGGAGPWAEVAVMRGTPTAGANATLSPVGVIDVSTAWAAPTVAGNKTLSITTSADIVKGDDLWVSVGSKTNVLNGQYKVRGCPADEFGGGGVQTKGTSGALSAYSGTSVSVSSTHAAPAVQLWL